MTVTVADIIALKQRIESDRKKLEEREKALAVVADMLREQNAEQGQLALTTNAVTDAAELGDDDLNFTQTVREAVKTFKGVEFHSSQVEAVVKASPMYTSIRSNQRIRISQILRDLAKKEVIRLTKHGKGSRPSMYRLRQLSPNGAGSQGD